MSWGVQAENVELLDDDHIKFDFLGKDSIKYENTVHVKHAVWANMKAFKAETQDGDAKAGGDQLFDAMNAQARAAPSGPRWRVHVGRTHSSVL